MNNNKYIEINKVIGKYYERKTGNEDVHAFKVIGFDGKYYQTIDYYLSLGSSVKEYESGLSLDFWKQPNFIEVTEQEFQIIESLYDTSGKYEYKSNSY